jgi:hypothetical protein
MIRFALRWFRLLKNRWLYRWKHWRWSMCRL